MWLDDMFAIHPVVAVNLQGFFTGNEVIPLPALRAYKYKTTNNGKEQPDCNLFAVKPVACFNSQYHSNRAHNKVEGHETHVSQRMVTFPKGEVREHFIGVSPCTGKFMTHKTICA